MCDWPIAILDHITCRRKKKTQTIISLWCTDTYFPVLYLKWCIHLSGSCFLNIKIHGLVSNGLSLTTPFKNVWIELRRFAVRKWPDVRDSLSSHLFLTRKRLHFFVQMVSLTEIEKSYEKNYQIVSKICNIHFISMVQEEKTNTKETSNYLDASFKSGFTIPTIRAFRVLNPCKYKPNKVK